MIDFYVKLGGHIQFEPRCINEIMDMPLWNNSIITNGQNKIDSTILKPAGIMVLEQVTVNNTLINFRELALK